MKGKPGWELRQEDAPSICRHYIPLVGEHQMAATCWCHPYLQSEYGLTVVMHNDTAHEAAKDWPFASQHT